MLSDLHLSKNQLSTFDPAVLAKLADTLRYLYIDGNPLEPIPPIEEFEAVLPNLIELELPAAEPVDELMPSELPSTGGRSPDSDVMLLLLIVGAAAVIAGVSMVTMVRQRRPR